MSEPFEALSEIERRRQSDIQLPWTDANWAADQHELSGLPNRRALYDALDYASTNLAGNHGLLFIDLDSVKSLNDTEGHLEGDKYIQHAASILEEDIRSTDLLSYVTHLGGDEFAILVPDVQKQEQLDAVKARLQTDLDDLGVPNSIGAALHVKGLLPTQLLKSADELMYADKEARKLAALTKKERDAYIQLGTFASLHGLNLRDAPAIVAALRIKS